MTSIKTQLGATTSGGERVRGDDDDSDYIQDFNEAAAEARAREWEDHRAMAEDEDRYWPARGAVEPLDEEGGSDGEFARDLKEAASDARAHEDEEYMEISATDRLWLRRRLAAYDLSKALWDSAAARDRETVKLVAGALLRATPPLSRGLRGAPSAAQLLEILGPMVPEVAIGAVCAGGVPSSWEVLGDAIGMLERFCASGQEPLAARLPHKKARCGHCGCMVNPFGHKERCGPVPAVESAYKSEMRRLSWLGDAVHRLDVRKYLLFDGITDAELEQKSQEYVSREAQAAYFSTVSDPDLLSRGASVNLRSEAFEANYYGKFRKDYVENELVVDGDMVVPGFLRVFVPDFPFSSFP